MLAGQRIGLSLGGTFFLGPGDVRFPSACYEYVLLSLVNKEVALGQWLNRIKSDGKSKQRYRKKEGRESQGDTM